MTAPRVEISAGAAFVAALLFFFLRGEELLALLLPVAAHELGHLAAILALGQRPQAFRAELGGFSLAYAGDAGVFAHLLIAAAGPLAGFAYALAAARLENSLSCSWLGLSAGASLALSLFNLLPALPLDGGQMLSRLADAALGERRSRRLLLALSLTVAAALLTAGAVLALRKRGAALLLVGAELLFRALDAAGLVKTGKIR